MLQGVKLSKDSNPYHGRKIEENEKFIPYAMLCARPIVYLAMSLTGRYNSDPGVDHCTTVKIILSNWMTKEIFLDYGGDKEFVVKSYADASFYTDPDDSESQSGYILKVGAIS